MNCEGDLANLWPSMDAKDNPKSATHMWHTQQALCKPLQGFMEAMIPCIAEVESMGPTCCYTTPNTFCNVAMHLSSATTRLANTCESALQCQLVPVDATGPTQLYAKSNFDLKYPSLLTSQMLEATPPQTVLCSKA